MKVWVIIVNMPSGNTWYCGKSGLQFSLTKELGGATRFCGKEKAESYKNKLIEANTINQNFNNFLEVKECFYNADEDIEASTPFH